MALIVLYGAEHLGYFKGEGITAQFSDFEGGAEVIVHQLKIGRYFIEPLRDQANSQIVERVVRAVAKTQKRLREDPEAAARVAQKIFPTLDVELIRGIIALQRASYLPAITEEMMRTANQSQKRAGVVKSDFPYDKVVAVQQKPIWDQ